MLTGVRVEAAEQIAKECGITEVIANVRADEKAAYITSLKEQGKHVAMVGDGINDAAALAVADVGIAMGAGSDIALDSADIVLLRNDLMDAMSALELGRVTVKKIEQISGGPSSTTSLEFHWLWACFAMDWLATPTRLRSSSNVALFCECCHEFINIEMVAS